MRHFKTPLRVAWALAFGLMACRPHAAAADSYAAGASTLDYQYSLGGGVGIPNSVLPGSAPYWWDSSLPTAGMCPVSLECPLPVQILGGSTGGGGSVGWSGGSVTAPGYVTPVHNNAVETSANPGFETLEGTLPAFAVTPTFNIGTAPSLSISNFPATQPISAAALPLPSGAATGANQSTEIGALGTIATNTGSDATAGNQTSVQSTPGTPQTKSITVQGNTGGIPVPISEAAASFGGASSFAATGGTGNALLTATPVTVKTGAGTIYGWDFVNTGTSPAWVQVFDATSVTLGTTVPLQSKWIPVGAWEEKFPVGVAFANGLMLAATSTATGSTAPATGINANVEYK